MHIWRLEDENGMGPHQGGDFRMEMLLKQSYANTKKRDDFPRRDSMPFEQARYGCPNREDVVEWFGIHAIAAFFKMGFSIACYEVPEEVVVFSQSHSQVIFDKTKAQFEFKINSLGPLFR